MRRFLVVILCAGLVVICGGCAGEPAFDRQRLEEVEDLAESLANDLLAFSVAVRDRDAGEIPNFFAEEVSGPPLPAIPPAAETYEGWLSKRKWEFAEEETVRARDAFLAEFDAALVGRFESLEDVRFKVVTSELASEAEGGTALLKFFVVGRNEDGRREWLKGRANVAVAKPAESRWRISRFAPTELAAKVAAVDLFSEVAFPAGVAARYPAFGEGKNEGFVYHGVATADVDGDGLLDVAVSGVERNRLYLNVGDGTFRDVGEESLVSFAPVGSGALFLDYDNDGDSDLFFAAVGSQILLENRRIPDGELRFWDVSERAGVDRDAVGFSAIAADVNSDGYPDVYVSSYNRYGTVMPNSWIQATNGTPNLLLVNQGDGTFREEAAERGVADDRWTYASGFVDIDEDGDQDLYVANDFGENALYRNTDGRFEDAAAEFGIVDPGFGMGVAFGDYDNDGDLDLHVTNMSSTAGKRILKRLYPDDHEIAVSLGKQAVGNSLYRNEGDGSFEDVTQELGGLSGGWAFGGGFIDFDNDGREDLYTPNGFVSGKSMKDT